jgi:hypothetical protein
MALARNHAEDGAIFSARIAFRLCGLKRYGGIARAERLRAAQQVNSSQPVGSGCDAGTKQ